MNKFQPHIIPVYPAHNDPIFEEWISSLGNDLAIVDRYLIPVHFTSYHVNNNYGNDHKALAELQEFIDSLDRNKKWFSITQYDDSVLIDFKDLDVMRFEMSKNIGVPIPLMCQPHPYKFISDKKWLVSFVGSRTHPVRNGIEKYINKENWYVSYEPHDIETYCRILHESVFVLCPRGYGLASFRCAEAMQYNAIPIYISDEHVIPFGLDFNEYGLLYKAEDIPSLATTLSLLNDVDIVKKQIRLREVYEDMFTYEGCFNHIMKSIETEYNSRQS